MGPPFRRLALSAPRCLIEQRCRHCGMCKPLPLIGQLEVRAIKGSKLNFACPCRVKCWPEGRVRIRGSPEDGVKTWVPVRFLPTVSVFNMFIAARWV